MTIDLYKTENCTEVMLKIDYDELKVYIQIKPEGSEEVKLLVNKFTARVLWTQLNALFNPTE